MHERRKRLATRLCVSAAVCAGHRDAEPSPGLAADLSRVDAGEVRSRRSAPVAGRGTPIYVYGRSPIWVMPAPRYLLARSTGGLLLGGSVANERALGSGGARRTPQRTATAQAGLVQYLQHFLVRRSSSRARSTLGRLASPAVGRSERRLNRLTSHRESSTRTVGDQSLLPGSIPTCTVFVAPCHGHDVRPVPCSNCARAVNAAALRCRRTDVAPGSAVSSAPTASVARSRCSRARVRTAVANWSRARPGRPPCSRNTPPRPYVA
jgi:hypothetical protein